MNEAVQQYSELEVLERAYWLGKEKRLASSHRLLSAELRQLPDDAPQELRDALQAALWHLGVAIVRANHYIGLQTFQTSSCAYRRADEAR